jgi:alpha-tubulin suppressor-like RCC1 family protein
MATSAYGLKGNTNYVITSNTLYEIGRNYRFSTSVLCQTAAVESQWSQIASGFDSSVAMQSNGTLWSWGLNTWGQLGLNTRIIGYSSPVQIGTESNWAIVASSNLFEAATQSNGTLWMWGNNSWGQLGTSNQINYSSPIQVGTESYWTYVTIGGRATAALKNDSTLWAWGSNSFGQLGLSNLTHRSSPVQVGTAIWTKISSGWLHTAGIQSNGTLYTWGNNNFGQLGLSNQTNRSSPVQVGALSNWAQISCGYLHTGAIQSNGTLWMWGMNSQGQLGLNTFAGVSSPVQVGTNSNWAQVSCGYFYTAARQSDGTLWAWGNNSWGQLGLGNITRRSIPLQVGAIGNRWKNVDAGYYNLLAIQSNGTLWSAGRNTAGQLGYDSNSYRSSALQVGTSGVWTGFPQGSQNNFWGAAINSNSNLYVWGNNSTRLLNYNYYGQDTNDTAGDGTILVNPVPLDTTLSTPIKAVSIGDQFGVYVQSNGTLWSWGNQSFGQLGQGIISLGNLPRTTYLSNWVNNLATGFQWTLALQSDGTLWSWGANSSGSLGIGDTTHRSSPIQVNTATNWTKINTGYLHSLAIQSPGTLWVWGLNSFRQLGTNTTTLSSVLTPVQVGTLSTWTQISGGFESSAAIQSDGTLWSWGNNSFGQLGTGNQINYSSPIKVGVGGQVRRLGTSGSSAQFFASIQSNGTLWTCGSNALGVLGLSNTTNRSVLTQVGAQPWTNVAGGSNFCYGIQSNGTLWSWGNNANGQLGSNNRTNRSSPVQVGALSTWTQISNGNTFAINIRSDGTMWGCGDNFFGYLGLGDNSPRSSPVQIAASQNWTQVSTCGYFSLAINSNGTLWGFGRALTGAMGNNTSGNFSNPQQIGIAGNWVRVSCGYRYVAAIQAPGTLWAWGQNGFGQLGTNNTIDVSTPIQVGAENYWAQVSCGDSGSSASGYMLALQSNGTLWAWGNNSLGQLGFGDLTHRSSPTQVGNISTWTQVSSYGSFSYALKSDGTVWATGNNSTGQLGFNNQTAVSSPVQISSTSPDSSVIWTTIANGNYHSLGVQSGGTLWAWGLNSSGQLGTNTSTLSSVFSPVQIGTESYWAQISARGSQSAALLSNGTLWMWGLNDFGQLGLSNQTNRSSPVQVGALSNWAQVAVGFQWTVAIQSNGTIWAWGLGSNFNQLGLNTSINYSSPVQIGTLSLWTRVACGYSHSAAVRNSTNLNLYTWGNSTAGALGYLGIISPIQISTDSNWVTVSSGPNWTLAVQSNGTLWSWGDNSAGQLGRNIAQAVISTPAQVGAVSNWAKVACGFLYSVATQSNGTLWAWGNNSFGQLGQGNYTHRSSPIQVGTINKYANVYAMNFTTLAETQ